MMPRKAIPILMIQVDEISLHPKVTAVFQCGVVQVLKWIVSQA